MPDSLTVPKENKTDPELIVWAEAEQLSLREVQEKHTYCVTYEAVENVKIPLRIAVFSHYKHMLVC